ncbi:uncharacterized protein LOC115739973 isoform X1 [Rhodamnia argentea]|uniref:Uncharacterized protein LOC115739973 isoform X1 n=1 Tax=Rhodamnia argentea TaxID=178133 RepID=A0ABM3HFT7_9MYRT|nr:uncharacterized protein LOC115739973 isoform X1 [Rhodamnia argentea]
MASLLPSHHCNWSQRIPEFSFKGKCKKVSHLGYSGTYFSPDGSMFFLAQQPSVEPSPYLRRHGPVYSSSVGDGMDSENSEDEPNGESSTNDDQGEVSDESLREKLERIVGMDDSTFSGIDLATLIRNKYGRSYDIQLIKKPFSYHYKCYILQEFMGRNLLALNVMWKYLEQRSFPLTEEEYILRLDDVANTLKCWGAVSHIRNSLAKSKDRPRIGKAVSIFIDMDESGGRANEWIYK